MSPMIIETLLNERGERGVRVRLKRFHDGKWKYGHKGVGTGSHT